MFTVFQCNRIGSFLTIYRNNNICHVFRSNNKRNFMRQLRKQRRAAFLIAISAASFSDFLVEIFRFHVVCGLCGNAISCFSILAASINIFRFGIIVIRKVHNIGNVRIESSRNLSTNAAQTSIRRLNSILRQIKFTRKTAIAYRCSSIYSSHHAANIIRGSSSQHGQFASCTSSVSESVQAMIFLENKSITLVR